MMAEYLLESFNIWKEILQKVDPPKVLFESIKLRPEKGELEILTDTLALPASSGIYLAGAGKASAGMALGVENALGEHLKDGMVISTPDPFHHPKRTRVITGSHPYPDHKSFNATKQLLEYIRQIPAGSLLLNLFSGGTSSLLCRPAGSITEGDLQSLYRQLVTSGAEIGQINTVRKAVSTVKGGQMLRFMEHLLVVDLVISDVPDDNLEDVGSGPTTPQEISYKSAKQILMDRALWQNVPESVRDHINSELARQTRSRSIDSSKKDSHPQFILSSARIVSAEARQILEKKGYDTGIDPEPWSGSIDEFEVHIRQRLESMLKHNRRPAAHVFFGECTLKVTGSGKGGRNQELALRMARYLCRFDGKILFLSAGTDGIDGPTDAAGALVDETTWEEGKKRDAEPDGRLAGNDSYHFFRNTPWHIKTGPTGNNVMDIQILMLP
jgi:glycerate-2-kinase